MINILLKLKFTLNLILGTGITSVSLHPGEEIQEIREIHRRETTIHCAVSGDIPNYNGCYFSDSKVKLLSSNASSSEDAEKLWLMSVKLVKLE